MTVERPGSIKMTELSELNAKGLESLGRLCRPGEVAVRRAERRGASGQVDRVVGSMHDVVQAGGIRQELTDL